MKKFNNYFDNLNIKIKRYKYINGNRILETDTGKYEIKEKTNNIKEIYEYLDSKNFNNYLNIENNFDDPYEIYAYIEDNTNSKDKAIDLVYLLAILHNKTTIYQETNNDNTQKLFETLVNKIVYLNTYYNKLQDEIETKIYMSPAEYLLIRNISKIYNSINYSRYNVEQWYKIKKDNNKERIVLNHNNISLDNFISKNKKILKNWDKSKKDYVIYDFYKFYRNNYNELEFSSLFNIYQTKYKFTEEEILLFKALIFMPWKVELKDNNYNNCINVNNLLEYIEKTQTTYLEKNKKNQKTNNDKLDKQDNNV